MSRRAQSIVDVMLGEGGGVTPEERYQDYLGIASVIANRSALTGKSPTSIISARRSTRGSTRRQFDAYGKRIPDGVERYRALAEKALKQVEDQGPIHNATFYATPDRVGHLPSGLTTVAQTKGHIYSFDPKGRPIATSQGYVAIGPEAVANMASAQPTGLQAVADVTKGNVGWSTADSFNSKVDPRLADALSAAASRFAEQNPGYTVEAFSGKRAPGGRQGKLHPMGMAVDVRIKDPSGNIVPDYQSAKSFRTYEKFAQSFKTVMDEKYPDIADKARWGGYFSGKPGKYGAADLMHFDLGGILGMGMKGGTWEKGLTDQQLANFPGAESVGMADLRPDLVPPGQEVASLGLAPVQSAAEMVAPAASAATPVAPAASETVSPSAPEGIVASLASMLSPVSSAYAAEPTQAENVPASQALETLIGTEPAPPHPPAPPSPPPAVFSDPKTTQAVRDQREQERQAIYDARVRERAGVPASTFPDRPTNVASNLGAPTEDDIHRMEREMGMYQPGQTEALSPVSSATTGISATTAPDVMSPRDFAAFAGLQPKRVDPLASEALSPLDPGAASNGTLFSNPTYEALSPLGAPALSPLSPAALAPSPFNPQVLSPLDPMAPAPAPLPDPNTVLAPPLPEPIAVPERTVAGVPREPAAGDVAAPPTFTAADIYGGQVGTALDNSGLNTVSRSDPHHTAVTNKYGVTTMSVDGNQVGSNLTGPLTKASLSKDPLSGILDGMHGPKGKGVLGSLLGAALGLATMGPAGAVVGGKVGKNLGRTGTILDPQGLLGRMLGVGGAFPAGPPAQAGAITGSNLSHDAMSAISPDATRDIERGIAGLY